MSGPSERSIALLRSAGGYTWLRWAAAAIAICGLHSPVLAKTAETAAQAIPRGRFEVLETSHYAPIQSPELVGPLLLKFLMEVEAAK